MSATENEQLRQVEPSSKATSDALSAVSKTPDDSSGAAAAATLSALELVELINNQYTDDMRVHINPAAEVLLDEENIGPIFSVHATSERFAKRVREKRESLGWSRLKLAQKMGLKTDRTIEAIELQKRNPSLDTAISVLKALEINEI